jgi:hypothetical protein
MVWTIILISVVHKLHLESNGIIWEEVIRLRDRTFMIEVLILIHHMDLEENLQIVEFHIKDQVKNCQM